MDTGKLLDIYSRIERRKEAMKGLTWCSVCKDYRKHPEFVHDIKSGQKGFTLIEMLVVVGIIVVLAAAILPNITRFVGSGKEGASVQEFDNVQTALTSMMADQSIKQGDLVANDLSTASDSIGDFTGMALEDYLERPVTEFTYCYDFNGTVTE